MLEETHEKTLCEPLQEADRDLYGFTLSDADASSKVDVNNSKHRTLCHIDFWKQHYYASYSGNLTNETLPNTCFEEMYKENFMFRIHPFEPWSMFFQTA